MFAFRTESDSLYFVKEGRITGASFNNPIDGIGRLHREPIRVVAPIEVGQRFVFRLPRFGGEVVRTARVVEIQRRHPVPKGYGLTVAHQIRELES